MNKKYMDFVPAGPQSRAVARGGASKTAVVKKVVKKTAVAKKPASANKFSGKQVQRWCEKKWYYKRISLKQGRRHFR